MSEKTTTTTLTTTGDFVTARELNLAVTFLTSSLATQSENLANKIAEGFRVTHDKQDHTNGRLLKAEEAIRALQSDDAVDTAVENLAEKARNRMDSWKVAALSTFGTSALGAVGWLLHKAFP